MRYSWRAPLSKEISSIVGSVLRFLLGGGRGLFFGLGFANMPNEEFLLCPSRSSLYIDVAQQLRDTAPVPMASETDCCRYKISQKVTDGAH